MSLHVLFGSVLESRVQSFISVAVSECLDCGCVWMCSLCGLGSASVDFRPVFSKNWVLFS
jgi:hypothetical protein